MSRNAKFARTTFAASSIGYLVPEGEFSGVVHSVFAAACNFRVDDGLLTLGNARVGNAPTTILLAGPTSDLRTLFDRGETVVVRHRMLQSARVEVRFDVARIWRARPLRALLPPVTLRERLKLASRYMAGCESGSSRVGRDAREVAGQLASATAKLDRARAIAALQRLIGLGEGLTPAGDDFVVGLLAGFDAFPSDRARQGFRDALGAAVVALAHRTTDVAAHFLRLAAQAHYAEALNDLRDTVLCEHRADLVQAAVDRLLQIGATSGADTQAGFVAALEAWLASEALSTTP